MVSTHIAWGYSCCLVSYPASFPPTELAWFHPSWINVFSAEKRDAKTAPWQSWSVQHRKYQGNWRVTTDHCSCSFLRGDGTQCFKYYCNERLVVRIADLDIMQNDIFAETSDPVFECWVGIYIYIYTLYPTKTSLSPQKKYWFPIGGINFMGVPWCTQFFDDDSPIQAADRKIAGWFTISQNFWFSKRLVLGYQKLDQFDLDIVFNPLDFKIELCH